MNYWLAKADPDTDYSIYDLERDNEVTWDGVHNNQAILNIQKMLIGDTVMIYHSQKQKAIVGQAIVIEKPFLNTKDPRRSWAVKLKFDQIYKTPIYLSQIKEMPEAREFLLVRNSRLSVMPVDPDLYNLLSSISKS